MLTTSGSPPAATRPAMPRPIGIRIPRAEAGKPTASSTTRFPSLSVSKTEQRRHRSIDATRAANPELLSDPAEDSGSMSITWCGVAQELRHQRRMRSKHQDTTSPQNPKTRNGTETLNSRSATPDYDRHDLCPRPYSTFGLPVPIIVLFRVLCLINPGYFLVLQLEYTYGEEK